jgi:hypothetical protein
MRAITVIRCQPYNYLFLYCDVHYMYTFYGAACEQVLPVNSPLSNINMISCCLQIQIMFISIHYINYYDFVLRMKK